MKFKDGPTFEPSLALRFLIEKCKQREPYLFSAPLLGLALAVLSRDADLGTEFKRVISPTAMSPEQLFRASERIFRLALEKISDDDADDTSTDEIPSLEPKIAEKVLMVAQREGREMLKSKAFTFFSIWESFIWMGLHTDSELLKDFEERSLLGDVEPESAVKCGLQIIKEALSRSGANDQASATQRSSDL